MSLETLSQPSTPSGSQSHGKRKRSLAWLLPTGLALGFIAIIALLFGERLLPAVEVKTAPIITLRQEASAKTIEQPKMGKGSMIFQASGWVEPDPYTTYVSTLIDGVIHEVKVLEGQHVKKGDLLATLIDDNAKLNLLQAEQKISIHRKLIDAHCQGTHIVNAELEAAKRNIIALQAALAEAEDNYLRLKKIPSGAVSQQQVILAKLAQDKQTALVAKAKAEIPRLQARNEQIELERITMTSQIDEMEIARDKAKLALERTRIMAPMNGIVLHLHAAPGKKRMLGMDDPKSAVIVELYNPEKLQARIDVPLTEAAGIQIGQIVELTSDLLPEMIFQGKVTRITGEADIARNTLQAKVSIQKPDIRLRPEMLVRGKFFSTGSSHSIEPNNNRLAIYVPKAALVDEQTVWVVSPNNTAQLRKITLGTATKDGHHHVIDGLRSGEHVILPPHDALEGGKRIRFQTAN